MLCWRTSILADTSPARACSTWLAPAQFHDRLLADPHTTQALAETPPLLGEPTRIGMDPSERGGECPKHGASACSHGTFLHVARQTLKPPAPPSLHITGPSQCPRVDNPHPASIAGTRPAVAGRPGKVVAQVVWNCPSVAHWYNRQFTEDTLN